MQTLANELRSAAHSKLNEVDNQNILAQTPIKNLNVLNMRELSTDEASYTISNLHSLGINKYHNKGHKNNHKNNQIYKIRWKRTFSPESESVVKASEMPINNIPDIIMKCVQHMIKIST